MWGVKFIIDKHFLRNFWNWLYVTHLLFFFDGNWNAATQWFTGTIQHICIWAGKQSIFTLGMLTDFLPDWLVEVFDAKLDFSAIRKKK